MPSTPANQIIYRYVIELFDQESGDSLGRENIVAPDFEPAIRGASFRAWCGELDAGDKSPSRDGMARPRVEPRWHPQYEKPRIDGVTVTVGDDFKLEAPIEIFKRDASTFATRLVTEKKIEAGTTYAYRVAAFPGRPANESEAAQVLEMTIEADDEEFPEMAGDVTIADTGCEPDIRDTGHGDAEDLPVYLPQRVFSQAGAMAEHAEGHEIGGFLVGHLCRVDGQPAAVVTDQLPAWHTERAEMSLTFSPQTWQALDESLALRGRDELLLGWHHLHPAKNWCDNCAKKCTNDEELQARLGTCPYQSPFFSEADRQMSRTAFSAPHQIGLLVVDTTLNGVQFGMFGWRNGVLVQRAYHVVDDTTPLISAAMATQPATAVAAGDS